MHFEKKTLKHIFIGVGICIILYWILHETEQVKGVLSVLDNIFSPFVFGAGLAFVINVPMRSIENKLSGIKHMVLRRTIALVITLILFLLVLALVFYLLIPQVIETGTNFATRLPGFFQDVQTETIAFLNEHPQLLEWVNENVDLQSLNYASLIQKALDVVSDGVSIILSGAVTAIGDIAGTLMNAVIGIVFSVYCLFNKEDLARQGRKILYAYLPEKWSDNTIRVLRMTNTTFSNFLSGQCLEVCILGCMFAVSMAIFNMPYIPLVSVLVAVTAFIPVVGAFIGCIVGAFFILVNNPVQALWFVVMFLVIQQVEGNLIYPRVVGTSIGLPGMWVLLAVAVGGELMGVAGMFLMIPLSSVIYALFREITKKKLDDNNIDESKLQVQPPELRSRLKKHVERFKKKKADKKPDKKAEKK
jgi:predicted PurR-regulated permease PerM